ncbi:hypothetical protein JB92DRAFT_2806106 [Gautieria morchelliformis]|nr:hypothetical protein JB92DRAFT_2806106 [Gautieria morchelliformis]
MCAPSAGENQLNPRIGPATAPARARLLRPRWYRYVLLYSMVVRRSKVNAYCQTPPTPPPMPTPTPTPTHDAHAHAHARDAAARTIQTFVRAQLRRVSALRRISDIARRLEDATAHFVFPAALDFADVGDANGHAAAVPALLYTPANAALHGHEDALMKLLSEADAVESGGDAPVRRARKALVGRIEGALGALDAQVVGVWRARGMEVDGGEERGQVCPEGDAIGVDISMN